MPEVLPLKLGSNGHPKRFDTSDALPPANGGVPGGGLETQVLTKNGPTDFDYNWAEVPGGGTTITPAQLTADQDDYDPTGFSAAGLVRISGDSGLRAITGMPWYGRSVKFRNVGTHTIFFVGPHPDSTVGNRIFVPYDMPLFPGQTIEFDYDETDQEWYPICTATPRTDLEIYYDPMIGSATLADYGILNMLAVASGTIATIAGNAGIPGHLRLATLAANATGYYLTMPKAMPQLVTYQNAFMETSALLSIAILSNATDRYTAGIQISQTVTNTTLLLSNSLGIRYTDNENGGNWTCYTRNSTGVETVLDSGITVAIDTLYQLRVSLDKSNSEARFYINNVMVGRITTNLPNNSVAAGYRVVMLKTAGTNTARSLRVHKFTSRTILAI